MTRTLLALLTSLALLFAASPAMAGEEEMGERQAGRVYLDAACLVEQPVMRWSRVVFEGRERISYADLATRLPAARRASRTVSWAEGLSSRRLFNPPAPWPTEVADLVEKVATREADLAYWFSRMGQATTAREFGRYVTRAGEVPSVRRVGVQIRARLGLPSSGGC